MDKLIPTAEMTDSMMKVMQLPVIAASLRSVADRIREQTTETASLVCSVDNLAEIRRVRAAQNAEFKAYEETRKRIKAEILKPLEAFEDEYKASITEPYSASDKALAAKISSVEDGIKSEAKQWAQEYFAELAAENHVEWLAFERCPLKITLTNAQQATHATIKSVIADFVIRIAQEQAVILGLGDSSNEVMVEYRKTLKLRESIDTVAERKRQIAAQQAAAQRQREQLRQEAEAVKAVQAAIRETAPETPVPVQAEPVYTATFTVTGTKTELIKLREFMKLEGIKYAAK